MRLILETWRYTQLQAVIVLLCAEHPVWAGVGVSRHGIPLSEEQNIVGSLGPCSNEPMTKSLWPGESIWRSVSELVQVVAAYLWRPRPYPNHVWTQSGPLGTNSNESTKHNLHSRKCIWNGVSETLFDCGLSELSLNTCLYVHFIQWNAWYLSKSSVAPIVKCWTCYQ